MNHSGDAAEQIVRISLEGVEVAAKITGTAAKEIALFLLAALKSPEDSATGGIKLKGKERLNSMLKSGKALEIFSVRERDLRTFAREAKKYGIVYCVLRNSKNTPDGLCDVMVRADDAPKINRIVERFKFAAVDKAKIESEIVQEKAEQAAETPADPSAPADEQPVEPEINDVDALLDELLGVEEGKAEPEEEKSGPEKTEHEKTEPITAEPEKSAPKKSGRRSKNNAAKPEQDSPPLADGGRPDSLDAGASRTRSVRPAKPPATSNPSEPSSGSRKNTEKRSSSKGKPSVKQELREIAAAQKAKSAEAAKRDEPPAPVKKKEAPASIHKQPQKRRKPKSRESKAR